MAVRIRDRAKLEVAATPNGDQFVITVTCAWYKRGRFGLPWAARVTSWVGKAELKFGVAAGDHNGAHALIAALPGDVVRWGIKDFCYAETEASWGIVREDGSVERVDERAAKLAFDARPADRVYNEIQTADPALDAKIEELQAACARLEREFGIDPQSWVYIRHIRYRPEQVANDPIARAKSEYQTVRQDLERLLKMRRAS